MVQQRYFDEVTIGEVVPAITHQSITSRMLAQWAAGSGDFHEIHYDKDYALAQNLPDVVVHGPMKLALLGRLLLAWAGPQGWLRRMRCRYTGLDVKGTTLTCRATVQSLVPETREVTLALVVDNEHGAVTATGTATVVLPVKSISGGAGHGTLVELALRAR